MRNIVAMHLLASLAVSGACLAAPSVGPALADVPLLATSQVPPNVMLTLSVEWPTGVVAAYNDNRNTTPGFQCPGRDSGAGICYFTDRSYLGYFDPAKCYAYDTAAGYFVPRSVVKAGGSCNGAGGRWSGNYLNWASAHALDEFRYAMTGGDRFIDTPTNTVIEKSVHTGQGGHSRFPIKRIRTTPYTGGTPNVPGVDPSTVTPMGWATAYSRVNNGSFPLAAGTSRVGRVVQFANNYGFYNAFPERVRYVKVQLPGSAALGIGEVQVLRSEHGEGHWSTCAGEGAICTITETSEVRFGSPGNWSEPVIMAGTTACKAATFGAPGGDSRVCQSRPMIDLARKGSATQSSTDGSAVAARAIDGDTSSPTSISLTRAENAPWLQVDLGSEARIDAIVIFNRSDCCAGTLQGFHVFAGTDDLSTRSLESEMGDAALWKYQVAAQPSPAVVLAPQPTDAATELLNVRVQVCNALVGLESNCTSYGGVDKPTGVIQDDADKMRFGVMSYLNVDGMDTMGGVLREPLKYVGPHTISPDGGTPSNPHAEITSTGALVADPDGAVTPGGEYKSSGVINYLNKFGKVGTKSTLKGADDVSEMFYEALRYMRGAEAATPQFHNFAGADTPAARDGFPVHTDWKASTIDERPIQYACQKNYFVGIGDTNTWCDTWGPGNGRKSVCGRHDGGPSDDALPSVVAMDDLLGNNEGLGNLGSQLISPTRGNGYDIAGYAFWANTHDLLPDRPGEPWTQGKQTAQTYWVDVRETDSFNGVVEPKNQYWLAARYGGFETTQRTNAAAGQEFPPASFDPLNVNYFTGERPDALISSLRSVFRNILASQQSNAPAALTSNDLAVAGAAYLVRYDSANWTGEIIGETAGFDSANVFHTSVAWNSAELIDAQDWDSGRRIVAFNPVTRTGVPFRATGGLSAAQLAAFGASPAAQEKMIDYLRGDATNETAAGGLRPRAHKLGDIVDAAPIVVGAPSEALSEGANPGYAAFVQARKDRTPVLYVGANDGMLHAIDARVDSNAAPRGRELFAYVPTFVMTGPSSPATPRNVCIVRRAAIPMVHKNLVDGQASARSVDLGRTGGSTGTPDWRTVLVGALGKGGKGIYALDVTDPSSWTTESAVARKVMWEYTDPDMGFGFGTPQIVKTAKWGWVVLVASGYGNASGAGWLAVLDAKNGALLQKIPTGVGSPSTPAGLAQFTAFAPDRSDFTVDAAYAGDLLGNVWRFDLGGKPASYPAATLLFTATDANGRAQPITARPSVAVAQDSLVRYVFFGTGRMLDPTDVANAAPQTFYALRDGLQGRFGTTQADGSELPIRRGSLVRISDTELLTGKSVPPAANGWYVDFSGVSKGKATERLVGDIDVNNGLVAFATETPTVDPCSPGVSSRLYVIDFATGKTALVSPTDGTPEASYTSESAVFAPTVVADPTGSTHVLVTTSSPALSEPNGLRQTGLGAPVKMNWVEVFR